MKHHSRSECEDSSLVSIMGVVPSFEDECSGRPIISRTAGTRRAPCSSHEPPAMSAVAESIVTASRLIVGADPALVRTVALSFAVSGSACLGAAWIGLLAGAWLAVARFAGRRVVLLALDTLLALPSVVVGLVVYLGLSRSGPLGAWGLLFTPTAMVLAQTILVVPIVAALSRQVVADALRDGGVHR